MKKAIIAASFGTTYEQAAEKSISAVEEKLRQEFNGFEVRRAYTSRMVIAALKKRGEQIDTVEEALEKLADQGYTHVYIQPTHIINGFEYNKITAAAEKYKDKFTVLETSTPLLDSDEDIGKVCDLFENELGSENAVAVMGHGTEHSANAIYTRFAEKCKEKGYKNIFAATVEGTLTLEDIIPQIKAAGFKEVIITPFLLVAGDHANNDMAGDEPDSWKSALASQGFEVVPVVKGLGEYAEVREMYAEHLRRIIK